MKPSASQSAATRSATAWSAGLIVGVRAEQLDRVAALVAFAGRQLVVDLRPARLRERRRGGRRVEGDRRRSAAVSNAHDVGGIGESARVAIPPNAFVDDRAAGRAPASSAFRTAGSRSSGWPTRRLSSTAVSVVPG